MSEIPFGPTADYITNAGFYRPQDALATLPPIKKAARHDSKNGAVERKEQLESTGPLSITEMLPHFIPERGIPENGSQTVLALPQLGRPNHLIIHLEGEDGKRALADETSRQELTQTVAVLAQEQVAVSIATNIDYAEAVQTLGELSDINPTIRISMHNGLADLDERRAFYQDIIDEMNGDTRTSMVIGHDINKHALPAIGAGMGNIYATKLEGLPHKLKTILNNEKYGSFDPERLIEEHFKEGEVSILGVLGNTGAGKSTLSNQLVEISRRRGIPVDVLGMDDFHFYSREEKKVRFKNAKNLPDEERWYIEGYDSWFDFEKAKRALEDLKQGKAIDIPNTYDYATGEMVGRVQIAPNPDGHIIVFEGVALHHVQDQLDALSIVTTHPLTRFGRLLKRDPHRPVPAAIERFRMTQNYEAHHHSKNSEGAKHIIGTVNRNTLMELPVFPVL